MADRPPHIHLKAVRDVALSDSWKERGGPLALRPKFAWGVSVGRSLLPAAFAVDLVFGPLDDEVRNSEVERGAPA